MVNNPSIKHRRVSLSGIVAEDPAADYGDEDDKLNGEVEMNEAYFGGRRKGQRGRGAKGKNIVLGLLEGDGKVYTRVVEHVSKEELMAIIRKKTRKGTVCYTDTLRSCNSLKWFDKHHTVSHTKTLVDRKTKNHINGIEVSGRLPSMSCTITEAFPNITFRCILKKWSIAFSHRAENLFKLFINIHFGYVSN